MTPLHLTLLRDPPPHRPVLPMSVAMLPLPAWKLLLSSFCPSTQRTDTALCWVLGVRGIIGSVPRVHSPEKGHQAGKLTLLMVNLECQFSLPGPLLETSLLCANSWNHESQNPSVWSRQAGLSYSWHNTTQQVSSFPVTWHCLRYLSVVSQAVNPQG